MRQVNNKSETRKIKLKHIASYPGTISHIQKNTSLRKLALNILILIENSLLQV